jgi:hypothetical protein
VHISQVNGPKRRKRKQLKQMLELSELDDFLRFLLFDVGRRAKRLKITECMRVARYLDWLAAAGVLKTDLGAGSHQENRDRTKPLSAEERDKKWCAEQIANVLWSRVRRMNAENAASNEEVLNFLKRHAETHLANPYIERALYLVEDYDVPSGEIRPVQQPTIVSRSLTAFSNNLHLHDDLSERLFVADYVLKRSGETRSRKRIAAILNQGNAQARGGRNLDPDEKEWLPDDIHERVRSFEKTLNLRLKTLSTHNRRALMEAMREDIAQKWIEGYRFAMKIENVPNRRGGG